MDYNWWSKVRTVVTAGYCWVVEGWLEDKLLCGCEGCWLASVPKTRVGRHSVVVAPSF